MKKYCLLFGISLLSACVYAGNHDEIGGFRKDFFAAFSGYGVSFYDNEAPQLVNSEVIEERNYKKNQAATAYRGYSVVNSKRYRKDFYSQEFVRPNKLGALNSNSIPHKFTPDDKIRLVGETSIDGKTYRLVPTELKNFVFLIDENGGFYNKMGQLKGSTLVLLQPEFFPFPEDLKLIPVTNSSTAQTKPVAGFDVKYDGVRMDRVWFTYMDYAGENQGKFENISFPNQPGLIEINGIGFRILNATDEKVDYMVLKD